MLAVTGANGHLGRRLLKALDGQVPVRALVRSERAAQQIKALELSVAPEIQPVDYLDLSAMATALEGCTALVHLVGIIKETATSSYRDAHEEGCRVLAEAAEHAGVKRMIYLNILGAAADATNPCLASRGRAEEILCQGRVPLLVLRVPMVLGEGDYASRALRQRADRGINFLLRGSSLEQPIYAGDVVRGIQAGLEMPLPETLALDLAGLDSLPRRELTRRAAALLGRRTRIVSLPLAVGLLAASLLERINSNPPVTRAMLGVLDHDDQIDPAAAVQALGIRLTPLTETLRRCLL